MKNILKSIWKWLGWLAEPSPPYKPVDKYLMVKVIANRECFFTSLLISNLQEIGLFYYDFRLWRHFDLIAVQVCSHTLPRPDSYNKIIKMVKSIRECESVQELPDDYDFSPSRWHLHQIHNNGMEDYYKVPEGFYVVDSPEYIDSTEFWRIKEIKSKLVFRDRTKRKKRKKRKRNRRKTIH